MPLPIHSGSSCLVAIKDWWRVKKEPEKCKSRRELHRDSLQIQYGIYSTIKIVIIDQRRMQMAYFAILLYLLLGKVHIIPFEIKNTLR